MIGISGGLDSTQALIVCARAMDVMGLPRANILAYTMPGFATSERTLDQARRLMQAVGATAHEIDIRPSCLQMLKDIGHPYARGEPVYDVTFENVQAGERTSHLFRLANLHNAPVVGTSDLSELALGWCTYGVGDHMAHYHVNASVPKTLIQYLDPLRGAHASQLGARRRARCCIDVLDTEISPELVPGDANGAARADHRRAWSGPYELQDFHLYYTLRFGYSAAQGRVPRVERLARPQRGAPGPTSPQAQRNEYPIGEIKRWLRVFLRALLPAVAVQAQRACPTRPRSAPAGRSRRAATGARRATARPRPGSRSSTRSRTAER